MTISSTRFNISAQIDHLIVDESSMIGFNDFEYLLGISEHIIFIGDWRQCCPIGEYGLPLLKGTVVMLQCTIDSLIYRRERSAIGVSQLTNQRGCFICTVVHVYRLLFSLLSVVIFHNLFLA